MPLGNKVHDFMHAQICRTLGPQIKQRFVFASEFSHSTSLSNISLLVWPSFEGDIKESHTFREWPKGRQKGVYWWVQANFGQPSDTERTPFRT